MCAIRVTCRAPLLKPTDTHENRVVSYGLGAPMQMSDRTAVVFLNRRLSSSSVPDFEAGNDAVVFEDADQIDTARAIPINRNATGRHPRDGRPVTFVKYPVDGGFVPLDARLPDGSPHPHAGTGFGTSVVLSFPPELGDVWSDKVDRAPQVELMQFNFDGTHFRVEQSEILRGSDLVDGWSVYNGVMRNAVPEGTDLLMATCLARDNGKAASGVGRWRRGADGWRPTEFMQATPEDGSCEPSLVRARDGALLLAVRGGTDAECPRLWRSVDNGAHWDLVRDFVEIQPDTPLSINKTVSGEMFVAGNPRCDLRRDPQGRSLMRCWLRDTVSLWPLSEDGREIGERVDLLRAVESFGPTEPADGPIPNLWTVDHPSGGIMRLADSALHSLLFIRVMTIGELTLNMNPTAYTGCRAFECGG